MARPIEQDDDLAESQSADEKPNQEARYFVLGKSMRNRPLFNVFWTDGKNYRVILSRDMTEDESGFYDRKNAGFG